MPFSVTSSCGSIFFLASLPESLCFHLEGREIKKKNYSYSRQMMNVYSVIHLHHACTHMTIKKVMNLDGFKSNSFIDVNKSLLEQKEFPEDSYINT